MNPFTITVSMARDYVTRLDKIDVDRFHGSVTVDGERRPVFFTPATAKVFLENIDALARRQRLDATAAELQRDKVFGFANVVFLAKLHNLLTRERLEGTTESRIAVARHLFTAATQGSPVTIGDIHAYRAHTVFGFGPRQFDSLFEAGDGTQVREALAALAATDANVRAVCEEVGWGLPGQGLLREVWPQ